MRRTTILTLAACCVLLGKASAEPTIIGERDYKDIVTVRGVGTAESKQALQIFPGISGKTSGANSLSLLRVSFLRGARPSRIFIRASSRPSISFRAGSKRAMARD
jgi:hypothetical protein